MELPKGRVAMVTGAGRRRIGNVVARTLARQGYKIALHYHQSKEAAQETVDELEQSGTSVVAVQADLADESAVHGMFDRVMENFGRLDALVTTAAVWPAKPLENVTAADVREQFDINALGTFLCVQRGGLIMVGQPSGGAIVTIGDWAVTRPYPGYAAYFISKGTIPTMTRSMAVELAGRNPAVRVNAILPGPVMLPDDLDDDERTKVIADTLVGREGRPEHVAHAAQFLIENDFVTGVCIPVDGGRTIAGGMGDRAESSRLFREQAH